MSSLGGASFAFFLLATVSGNIKFSFFHVFLLCLHCFLPLFTLQGNQTLPQSLRRGGCEKLVGVVTGRAFCPRSCPHTQGSGTDKGKDAGVQGLPEVACGQERGLWLCWGGEESPISKEEQFMAAHSRQASSSQIFQTKGPFQVRQFCTCLLGPRGVNLLFSCFRTVKILSDF